MLPELFFSESAATTVTVTDYAQRVQTVLHHAGEVKFFYLHLDGEQKK